MTFKTQGKVFAFLIFAFLFLLPGDSRGCDVPVFRYAFDHWAQENYVIRFFHKGTLKENEKKILEELKKYSQEGEKRFNYILEIKNLGENFTDKNYTREIQEYGLPFIIVHYPGSGERSAAWSGPVSEETLGSVFDSPKREEILNRLNAGEAAVWVFVESGNAEKDRNALTCLERELANLAKTPLIANRSTPIGSSAELKDAESENLKIVFSLVRISRSDPKEGVFQSILLSSEPDLRDYAGEPILFPVYGRGKILYSLVGNGITEHNIRKSAEFLVGSCSCLIKDSYPGTDILMSTQWKSASPSLEKSMAPEYSLTGVGSLIPAAETKIPSEEERTSPSPPPQTRAIQRTGITFTLIIILSFLMVGIAVLILFVLIRQRLRKI